MGQKNCRKKGGGGGRGVLTIKETAVPHCGDGIIFWILCSGLVRVSSTELADVMLVVALCPGAEGRYAFAWGGCTDRTPPVAGSGRDWSNSRKW